MELGSTSEIFDIEYNWAIVVNELIETSKRLEFVESVELKTYVQIVYKNTRFSKFSIQVFNNLFYIYIVVTFTAIGLVTIFIYTL